MQPVEWSFFSTNCRCIGNNKSQIGQAIELRASCGLSNQRRRDIDTHDATPGRNLAGYSQRGSSATAADIHNSLA